MLVVNADVATKLVTRPDGSEEWPRDVKELNLGDSRKTIAVNFFAIGRNL